MVVKIKSNHSLTQTIDYNNKIGSELIFADNLEGDTLEDYKAQMSTTQLCFRGWAKNLTLHCILSPPPGDADNLQKSEWIEIVKTYLTALGLETHQYIVFLHTSTLAKHAHIVINRVSDINYKLWYSKSNEVNLSHKVGSLISVQRGFATRKDHFPKNGAARIGSTDIHVASKTHLFMKHRFYAEMSAIRFVGVSNYFNELESQGFKVRKFFKKNTEDLKGYGVKKYGTFFPANKIDKKFELSYLIQFEEFIKRIQNSSRGSSEEKIDDLDYEAKFKTFRNKMRLEFSERMERVFFVDWPTYKMRLEEMGFEVRVFKNKATGAMHGYNVGMNGVYFTASEIGKEFTLRELKGLADKGQRRIEKTIIKAPENISDLSLKKENKLNFRR